MLPETRAVPASWAPFWGLLSGEQPGIPSEMLLCNAEREQVAGNVSADGGIEPSLKAVMPELINFSLAIRVILILITK